MMSRNSENWNHPVAELAADKKNNKNKSATAPPPTTSLLVLLPPPASRSPATVEVGEVQLPRNKHTDKDDDEGKWQQARSLTGGSGSSSSALLFTGGSGGDRDLRQPAIVDEDWWSSNIYENVVKQSFGGGYGKLRKCEENIYENICEDCGRLYGTEKCSFCAVDDDEEDVERTKKANKYSAKFQEFLGNFRIKPVKFGGGGAGSSIQGKRKLCRSDIVHNVDGFEDVFRTNKSFDLGEICRMRNDARSQVIVDVAANPRSHDRVLHKSDDQLASAAAVKHAVSKATSKAAVTVTTTAAEEKATTSPRLKVRSLSENLIDFSDRKSETIYENVVDRKGFDWVVAAGRREVGASDGLLQPVNDWMMSLLVETADYADCDEVTYHVKSIPSVTFNDISVCCGNSVGTLLSHHAGSQSDLSYTIEEFRQNVINSRRGEKEVPVEPLDSVVVTFRNSIFENQGFCGVEDEEQSNGTLTPGSPRVVPEDKSEFVAGLLNIFEAVLNREKEDARQNIVDSENGHANAAIRPYRAPQVNLGLDCSQRLSQCKQRTASGGRKRALVRKHLLEVSLCRVAIRYERPLKVFLLVLSCELPVRNQKLVLNKRKSFLKIMTNERPCNSRSALRESVEIDKYFQFLENNDTMLNLTTTKRRRRRKGELITPDLQSNSSAEISCSSTTSGVHSDECGNSLQDENIYQHIWTCKTEGTAEPVYESLQEHIYECITLDPARDEHEWEVVDDFAFSKCSNRRPPPPVPNRNIRHPLDRYRNVCILYNRSEPKINRIMYNYRRDYIFDYRQCDESSSSVDSGASSDDDLGSCGSSCTGSDDEDYSVSATSHDTPGKHGGSYSIPDCVQYWKFMLLNVNYNDDEEDVIMTEKTIAVISENVDKNIPVQDDPQSSPKIIQSQAPSSPGTVHLPHSPTFSGPAVKSKSQIPLSDSCVGTYTSKSIENLPDVIVPEKEKSPNPKRERLRDKMKAVLPLSSSRNSDDALVFGVELDQVERDEKLQVPRFVTECVEILKEPEYIETSGLYRASGNKNSIETIKKKLNNEKRSAKKYEFLKKQDVHSLTGSLKLFFRELKSPLIARDVYESCVRKTKDQAETIENIKLSIEKMELINRNTLRYIIRHLKCVHQNSHVNMMTSSNLAIVWGACLFASSLGLMESYENNDLGRINTLVKQLIDNYDKIFYSDKLD